MTATSRLHPPQLAAAANLRAALLMIAAMAAFAIEDAAIKMLTVRLPVGQVLATIGLMAAAVFWAMLRRQGGRLFTRALLIPIVLLRNGGEVVGSIGFTLALALTDLASASAILQALPLALVMGGALFLGERVGWRRWTAILVGFAGVLLIIRPGAAGFQPQSVLALVGVAGLAVRDLATRRMPARVPSHQLSASAFAALVPAGLVLAVVQGTPMLIPTRAEALGILGCIAFSVLGYAMMVGATRAGEASLIAPLRYVRLIFALLIAVAVFGERPDAATLAGAALVVGSGAFAMWRELVRNRRR